MVGFPTLRQSSLFDPTSRQLMIVNGSRPDLGCTSLRLPLCLGMLEMATVVKGLVIKVVLVIVVDVLAMRAATSVVNLVGLIRLTTTNSSVIIGFEDGTISFGLQLKSEKRAERSWSGSLQVSPMRLAMSV